MHIISVTHASSHFPQFSPPPTAPCDIFYSIFLCGRESHSLGFIFRTTQVLLQLLAQRVCNGCVRLIISAPRPREVGNKL